MTARKKMWYITVIAAALGIVASVLGIFVEYHKAREFSNTTNRAQAVADRAAAEYYKMIGQQSDAENLMKPFIALERDGLDINLESEIEHTVQAKISKYSVGGYRMSTAPSAHVSIALFKTAVSDVLDEISEEGVEANTMIIGVADGIPIRQGAVYVGDLGHIRNVPYYSRNKKARMVMNLEFGDPLANEEIAFLRAYVILQELYDLEFVRHSVRIETETTSSIGGVHRRILVRMHLRNALAKRYAKLSPIAKKIEEYM